MLFILLAILVTTSAVPGFALSSMPGEGSIALYVGSPLTLSKGVTTPLDPSNPNVAPVIHKDRTLVPARAIAEHFGAAVRFDAAKSAAVIEYGGKQYTFFFNKNYYDVSQTGAAVKRVTFDTETLVIENRAMLPLRVICEQVLGKSVSYFNKVILVGNSLVALDQDKVLVEEIRTKIGQAVKIASLWQLKTLLSGSIERYGANTITKDATVQPAAPASPGTTTGEGGSSEAVEIAPDYSSTNEQVAGINEADVVKTDGNFIYVASGNVVSIVKAASGVMTVVDTIKMPVNTQTGNNLSISELYIENGRLVILGSRYSYDIMAAGSPTPGATTMVEPAVDKMIAIYPPIRAGKNYTYTGVYSISAEGKATFMKELEVEGSMLSNRKKGDIVYLTVNKYNYYYLADDVLPMVRDTVKSNAYTPLSIRQVMYYPGNPTPEYLMIAAIDIRSAEAPSTVEAILGSGSQIYMSENSLYVARQDYTDMSGSMTSLSKFNVDGTKIGFAGGGKVKGTLLNQFSMDEYKGNFRVATTSWGQQSSNAVYILDANLNQIGALENLAPGETIYSARFMGEKGYLVTFRQIDPLFVLDLSVPTAPKVAGELKVPGFSNYLHPVAENLILGIGQGTQDIYTKDPSGQEIIVGTRTVGLKFSLFDVSDMGKPKELNTMTIGGSGSYAEMLYNHKAIMFDLKNKMFAFDATLSENFTFDKANPDYFNGAVVMTFDPAAGFNLRGKINALPANPVPTDGYYNSWVRRLCYIGDFLYYVQDGQIRSFDKATLKSVSSVSLF
jgi:uncharacterized secreted protein with C-terminal beta-propeller domain